MSGESVSNMVVLHLVEQLSKRVQALESKLEMLEQACEMHGVSTDAVIDARAAQRAEEEFSRSETHYWDNSIGAWERRKRV